MKYVCDAPDSKTWFRIETEAEAEAEAQAMHHKVDKYFRNELQAAHASYQPTSSIYIEQQIGLKAHLARATPLFLTLRDNDGTPLVTAMLPPGGKPTPGFRIIIVGPDNSDPYVDHAASIESLAKHCGITLDRSSCFPYRR